MAEETRRFIDLQVDLDVSDDPLRHQRSHVVGHGRDFNSLIPIWFDDEFDDFHDSDSNQSIQLRPLQPFFTVVYSESDDEEYPDELDRLRNLSVNADSFGEGDLFGLEHPMDLGNGFCPNRVEQLRPGSELMGEGLSASGFGLSDDDVELGQGLGFGLNFMEEENSDFMFKEVEDDDFCFRDLRANNEESLTILGNSLGSEVDDEEEFQGSDLCSEVSELDYANTIEDGSVNLCWDSFPLVDQREADEEPEWEEVDDGGDRNEELMREFNRLLDDLEDGTLETVLDLQNNEVAHERVIRWEVLLNAQNMGVRNVDLGNEDPYFSMEGYFDEDEYETMLGQFADTESGAMGKPPATKYVVENLAVVVMIQADVESNSMLCAVCKDDMGIGENAKILLCSHRYHGDCIIPWLGIRNTCPVCRFELPTDDLAYERRKTQMAGRRQ